jgi:hypothetical protein
MTASEPSRVRIAYTSSPEGWTAPLSATAPTFVRHNSRTVAVSWAITTSPDRLAA